MSLSSIALAMGSGMFAIMFFAIKYIAKVVMVPKYLLYPSIMMMCVVGAYAINYGVMFDVLE
ncbi:tripartite tricarboxylate transporter permease, partial [Serratia marcescens]|uniref:tripartite tricarboxylate transporter permease n=1 Tax=Serratia marcescens TaxID=615 RepID=UPI001953AAC4